MRHWKRFRSAVAKVTPQALSPLRAPASVKQIRELERSIEVKLSAELRDLLLVHNGQEPWDEGVMAPALFGMYHLNGVTEIAEQHESLHSSLDEGFFDMPREVSTVRQAEKSWCAKWIPFAQLTHETLLITDLAPGPDGSFGQVFLRGNDQSLSPVLAPSISEFLKRYADMLIKAGDHPDLWTLSDGLG